MSVKFWLTLGAAVSLLAACATHQENPNYAYSTKYKAGSATAHASASSPYVQAAPVSYQNTATTTYASSSIPSSGAYSRVLTILACVKKKIMSLSVLHWVAL